jgi:formate-dependent phosphoribosylglycinamide formyltransferase (GAR transformylase)
MEFKALTLSRRSELNISVQRDGAEGIAPDTIIDHCQRAPKGIVTSLHVIGSLEHYEALRDVTQQTQP